MTAQEERTHRITIWGACSSGCLHLDPAQLLKQIEDLKQVSVYTKTQLTEGTCSGCLHLDPAHSQHHHPSPVPQLCSSLVKALENPESLCVLFNDHHQKQE